MPNKVVSKYFYNLPMFKQIAAWVSRFGTRIETGGTEFDMVWMPHAEKIE
jgi:hypothetical protein